MHGSLQFSGAIGVRVMINKPKAKHLQSFDYSITIYMLVVRMMQRVGEALR